MAAWSCRRPALGLLAGVLVRQSNSTLEVAEPTREVGQVPVAQPAPPLGLLLHPLIKFVRREGEVLLEVHDQLRHTLPQRIKLGRDSLKELVPLVLVLLEALPHVLTRHLSLR